MPSDPPDEPTTTADGDAVPPPEDEGTRGEGALRRERRRLMDQRDELVYHLGGLVFELHRRDMLGEKPLRVRADELAALDDSVRAIDERLTASKTERKARRRRAREAQPEPAAPATCPACETPYVAGARFCWNCGEPVVEEAPADDEAAGSDATQVIDAGGGPA